MTVQAMVLIAAQPDIGVIHANAAGGVEQAGKRRVQIGQAPAVTRKPADPHTASPEGQQHQDRERRTVRFCALLTLRLE